MMCCLKGLRTHTNTQTSRWLSQRTQQRYTKSFTEVQPPLTHTCLKFNVAGTSLHLTEWEGGREGGWKREDDLQNCRPAAPLAACGTAHPIAGSLLQRERGRKWVRYTQFPVASPFFCSACLGRKLFVPLKSHQLNSGQLCVQTSFRGQWQYLQTQLEGVQKELLLPFLPVSVSDDEPDFWPHSHKMLYIRGMRQRKDSNQMSSIHLVC